MAPGESDSAKPELAALYQRKLDSLVNDLRTDLNDHRLALWPRDLAEFMEPAVLKHIKQEYLL